MTDTEPQSEPSGTQAPGPADPLPSAATEAEATPQPRGRGLLASFARYAITLTAVAIAGVFVWKLWDVYMASPWTRDGTVRVYVVTMAPEVAGRIVKLPVRDNQLVRKGDLLMVIEPTNYEIALKFAEAAVEQAEAVMLNAQADSVRRDRLMRAAVSTEEKETFKTKWLSAEAAHQQAVANLELARVNLERTHIYSPVNGYVTNLLAQLGDYANIGTNLISVVNADSFWVDGYFEETNLRRIRVGDPASIQLMGHSQIIRGHVDSIARGISVPNAQPNGQGLATVNPIFTWVRLAQRIPVRIHIDVVPPEIHLSAGMTATVQVNPPPRSDGSEPQPATTAQR